MTVRYATYAELIDALRSIPSGGGGLATNGLPVGGSTGQALTKASGTDYDAVWTDSPEGLPVGGSLFQSLVKLSATDYDVGWGNPAATNGLPTGGTTGQALIKSSATNYDAAFTTVGTVPVGGSSLQLLVKAGAADYSTTWANFTDYYNNQGLVTKGARDTTSRTSTSNTTLTATSLTFSVTSGTMYHIKCLGTFRSAATTTGLALGFSSTVATTYCGWDVAIEQAAAGTDKYYTNTATALTTTLISTAVVAANTDYVWELEGRFQPSASGTVTVGFRSEVSGSTITWQPGAMAILTAVA